MTQHN
jgi:hypothetical protein